MTYTAGYFTNATEGVYSVIRSALPPAIKLVTLAGDPVGQMREFDFVIAGKVTRAMIDAAPKLKLIQTPGVGYDGVDMHAAADRGIPVAITVCGNPVEVAEYTMMAMLAASRRLIEMDRELRAGRWLMWDRRLQSFNLQGKTAGIVGLGRIGSEVASRAAAFGMRVLYCDPRVEAPYERVCLDTLLAASDYVTAHVPLTPETRGMFNAARFARMKPGSFFINTARGEIVDESALVAALRSGHLAGAVLDVFADEPPGKDNPLLAFDNVTVTPHVASGTFEALQVKSKMYAENMQRVLAGLEPIDCVLQAGVAAV